jgi:predicted TIM-barrel fold metal-dependent hydrolase
MPHETGEVLHPQNTVGAMLETGVKAARIFPSQHLYKLRVWNLKPLLDALAGHAVPLFVDFGIKSWGDTSIDWDGLYEVGRTYPVLPIILTSINIGSNRQLIPLMYQLPNLYVETSYYTVHRGIELLDTTVGFDRILFGSGLPLRAPGPALTALNYSLIDDYKKKLVAGDNLRRLLNEVR